MTLVPGTDLNQDDQRHVLSAFVHRFTKDHKPRWPNIARRDGSAYPVQFASDLDWLANTRFGVRDDGRLDRRSNHCISQPTWPDNPELRQPTLEAEPATKDGPRLDLAGDAMVGLYEHHLRLRETEPAFPETEPALRDTNQP